MSDVTVEVKVEKIERYAVVCSEHGHIGHAYLDSNTLATVMVEKHLENQHQETPPDVIYDEIVQPIREWTTEELIKLQVGTSEEYENVHQIIEETIYKTIGAISGEYSSTVQ